MSSSGPYPSGKDMWEKSYPSKEFICGKAASWTIASSYCAPALLAHARSGRIRNELDLHAPSRKWSMVSCEMKRLLARDLNWSIASLLRIGTISTPLSEELDHRCRDRLAHRRRQHHSLSVLHWQRSRPYLSFLLRERRSAWLQRQYSCPISIASRSRLPRSLALQTLSKSICEREAIACVRRLVESSMGVLLFSLVVVNQRIGESLLVW